MIASLTDLQGVGDVTADKFSEIGVNNVWDLLHYFPRKYNDYSKITKISQAKPGEVTLKVKIKSSKGRYIRRGMHITEAVAVDDSGSIRLIWFNQPYRDGSFKESESYFVTGKLEFKSGKFAINSPTTEVVSDLPVHTARIVPVYRESKHINAKTIRKAMASAIKLTDRVSNLFPEEISIKHNLLDYSEALAQIHFPKDAHGLQKAKDTMSFIEVFELMLASSILKKQISSEIAHAIKFDETLAKEFVSRLPFKLTDAQRRTAWQIFKDIDSTSPANRLIEGDVGSGKTVVATMAILMALRQGYQVAYLAPTEILARQHYKSISELLALVDNNSIELLVGSIKNNEKKRIRDGLKSGDTRLVIGTHAILQGLQIDELALVIIDEQHRFGVEQRKELIKQTGAVPHVISMTATPIPRSLALTLYGELDISLLDSMPPGRKEIITKIVSPNSRVAMEEHIESEIKAGHQIYVVCPLIDANSKIKSASVETVFKYLSASRFKNYKVTMLHGKLSAEEKTRIMEDYMNGDIDILVSTTVIEVGVNVPNSTVMVIEGADRFGLAQMHQLRGRVGRSSQQAYCYIVPSDSKAPSKRLRAFSQVTDGFRLAELDLEIRGPGAIYGTMQHGALDLRFAKLSDHALLVRVRKAVKDFTEEFDLKDYPELRKKVRSAQAVLVLN